MKKYVKLSNLIDKEDFLRYAKKEFLLNLNEKINLVNEIILIKDFQNKSIGHYISSLIFDFEKVDETKIFLDKIFDEKDVLYIYNSLIDLYNYLDVPSNFDFDLKELKNWIKNKINDIEM